MSEKNWSSGGPGEPPVNDFGVYDHETKTWKKDPEPSEPPPPPETPPTPPTEPVATTGEQLEGWDCTLQDAFGWILNLIR